MTGAPQLPVDTLRPDFLRALEEGPVVVSAPTGSGKSTRVPAWCPGRVLVVEPRRVACRSLAQRVAELEGVSLGREVGYHVRNERRAGDDTRILFATPGIVLRIFDELDRWDTVILDELHERGLETDLLLALLAARRRRGCGPSSRSSRSHLVAMSATIAGDRVAEHLEGRHLQGEGRTFPVDLRHLAPDDTMLPDLRGIESRVTKAVATALSPEENIPGDVLVFLPGKGEIASCASALRSHPAVRGRGERGAEILELHGGLSLSEQSRAFATGGRRKVILSTNVAETSVTLPGIGVVVDSGLVRQTRWYRDRGFLTLVPIAADSADQRAGRAGRTAPGVCFRLWGEAAQLAPRTPPEIHRESLTPLVLAAAAVGEQVDDLPFLDPPREDALAAARDELTALGALRRSGREEEDGDDLLTARGRKLFGLPLDPALGRLLIEAVGRRDADPEGSSALLEDVVDLVSALSVDRPLPPAPRDVLDRHANPRAADPAEDPGHCDAVATLAAVRSAAGGRRRGGSALGEALSTTLRLRAAFDLPAKASELPLPDRPVDRRALASVVVNADPRTVHVARHRGRHTAWAAGGPELSLARESAARPAEEKREIEALAILGTHAVGAGFRKMRLLATCVMPLPLSWLVEEGLGEERLGKPGVEGDRVVARVERVWAGRVLDTREEVPRGPLAREALAELFLAGRVFPGARDRAEERLEAARLARTLAARGTEPRAAGWEEMIADLFGGAFSQDGEDGSVPELETWTERRIEELGVESGADLALLSPEDLLPPELPRAVRQVLDRDYPRRLELPDATYAMEYEPGRRTVTLVKTSGGRKDPPPLSFLPRFGGFRVRVRHGQMLRTIRDRR